MKNIEKLEMEIFQWMSNYNNRGKMPELIIVHPEFYEKFKYEVYSQGFFIHKTELIYRGIKIIRSFDLQEEEIILK